MLTASRRGARSTAGLFRAAAACVPLVWPNALLEAVLLGVGKSYRYIAAATLANCAVVVACTRYLLAARPRVSSAWACLTLFFVLRISCSATRVFLTERGGLGFDRRRTFISRAGPVEG